MHFFLWLSSIPPWIYLLYPFIYQCTFSCFHVLAIVNSAAMNFKVHVSFQIRVFLGYTPRSGVAGSYGNSVFSSEENSDFSLVAAPVYIPTNSVGGFPFSPHFLEEETFILDPETIGKEGYYMGCKI